MVECGVSYFDVKKACPYGATCRGVFDPREGFPVPLTKETDSSKVTGCPFGLFLTTQGVSLNVLA